MGVRIYLSVVFVLPGLMRSLAKVVFASLARVVLSNHGSKRGERGTAGRCEEREMKKRKGGIHKTGERT